ncbi:MAG: hypothetical protein OEW35_18975, partial [Gammaproteobacteria bacterium]|nr:hypothetical protein [Gammaproteobacteria bacterium]
NPLPEPPIFQEYEPAAISLFWVVGSNQPRLNEPPVLVGPLNAQVPEAVASPVLIVIEIGMANAAGANAKHPTSTKPLSLLIMLPAKFRCRTRIPLKRNARDAHWASHVPTT